jgi:cytochrome oxidase assembly protein ShyY1
MYRFLFRPKWIAFHLLVVVAIVVMVNLGFWQLRRLDERKALNSAVAEREAEPPIPLADLLAEPDFDPDTAEWRRVTAEGSWLPDQLLVFNRSQNGIAGENVLTALALDDGTTVLVNRGFVPLARDVPVPPTTEATILATVRESQSGGGEVVDPDTGELTEVQRVDVGRLAPQFDGDVAPVYLDLIASEPAITPADPLPVPPPEQSEGNHLSYAIQWFIFSACVVVGWVLAVRHSIGKRRAEASEAALGSGGDTGARADVGFDESVPR